MHHGEAGSSRTAQPQQGEKVGSPRIRVGETGRAGVCPHFSREGTLVLGARVLFPPAPVPSYLRDGPEGTTVAGLGPHQLRSSPKGKTHASKICPTSQGRRLKVLWTHGSGPFGLVTRRPRGHTTGSDGPGRLAGAVLGRRVSLLTGRAKGLGECPHPSPGFGNLLPTTLARSGVLETPPSPAQSRAPRSAFARDAGFPEILASDCWDELFQAGATPVRARPRR